MSDIILISKVGLYEATKCAICNNPNQTERGCDGACQYDKELHAKIVEAVTGLAEQRPHGEWRVHSHCSDGFSYKCSLCGRVVNQGYWFEQNEILSVYPYCHCGAKMIAVENPFKWYFGLGKSDDVTDMKYIKVGDTIYTQDDDKQGWTGREVK